MLAACGSERSGSAGRNELHLRHPGEVQPGAVPVALRGAAQRIGVPPGLVAGWRRNLFLYARSLDFHSWRILESSTSLI